VTFLFKLLLTNSLLTSAASTVLWNEADINVGTFVVTRSKPWTLKTPTIYSKLPRFRTATKETFTTIDFEAQKNEASKRFTKPVYLTNHTSRNSSHIR